MNLFFTFFGFVRLFVFFILLVLVGWLIRLSVGLFVCFFAHVCVLVALFCLFRLGVSLFNCLIACFSENALRQHFFLSANHRLRYSYFGTSSIFCLSLGVSTLISSCFDGFPLFRAKVERALR